MKPRTRTAGYDLQRVVSQRWWWYASAGWSIDDYPGSLLLCEPGAGWQLVINHGAAAQLPGWLQEQMRGWRPRPSTGKLCRWERGPFPTRQALLEALRGEQSGAEHGYEALPDLLRS